MDMQEIKRRLQRRKTKPMRSCTGLRPSLAAVAAARQRSAQRLGTMRPQPPQPLGCGE